LVTQADALAHVTVGACKQSVDSTLTGCRLASDRYAWMDFRPSISALSADARVAGLAWDDVRICRDTDGAVAEQWSGRVERWLT
jgi:hypothetical protein